MPATRGNISLNSITHTDGKPNWFAIGFVILLAVGIISQIIENYYNVKSQRQNNQDVVNLQQQVDALNKKVG